MKEQEIVRIYGMRWDIEVFFKATKALLKLQKEVQGRSYDFLVRHTAIVFARYIVLSWQNRCNTDERTWGGIFYELCDELKKLDWVVALQQLVEFLEEALEKTSRIFKNFIKCQLQKWLQVCPIISRHTCLF